MMCDNQFSAKPGMWALELGAANVQEKNRDARQHPTRHQDNCTLLHDFFVKVVRQIQTRS